MKVNGPGRSKLGVAVGEEACDAILYLFLSFPVPGFKGRTFVSSRWNSGDIISASAVPCCRKDRQPLLRGHRRKTTRNGECCAGCRIFVARLLSLSVPFPCSSLSLNIIPHKACVPLNFPLPAHVGHGSNVSHDDLGGLCFP